MFTIIAVILKLILNAFFKYLHYILINIFWPHPHQYSFIFDGKILHRIAAATCSKWFHLIKLHIRFLYLLLATSGRSLSYCLKTCVCVCAMCFLACYILLLKWANNKSDKQNKYEHASNVFAHRSTKSTLFGDRRQFGN